MKGGYLDFLGGGSMNGVEGGTVRRRLVVVGGGRIGRRRWGGGSIGQVSIRRGRFGRAVGGLAAWGKVGGGWR